MTPKIRYAVYSLLLLSLLILWQYAGQTFGNVRLLISNPTSIIEYFGDNYHDLLLATLATLIEAAAGLTIATAVSFSMMIICFYQKPLLEVVLPFMISSQVIPIIVFAPFVVLLFGIGYSSKIALASMISFFPIFLNFLTGYNSISRSIRDYFTIANASKTFQIFKVYFPLSLPNIFTGLKLGATLSVIGAIVAEFTGAEIGIGKNLFLTSIRIEPELMMLSILLSICIGALLFLAVLAIERLFGRWYLDLNKG